jgi:maltose alpha-D-glucosyltransferase/alpha-amylase
MLLNEPLWYKDAVIYEVHARAFCDADGDGTGDFRGLGQKLDYLQDLGVTAIWLLPFYPSPLKDDGYDIADYTGIHDFYGSIDDFREFLEQAHTRGLRVITELVINHTSDQHPWFQRARRAPAGSSLRDFYVWSDTPEKYLDARVIFKDFEVSNWTYDRVAGAYYWHRFYAHQPDLNFDNPAVWDSLFPVVDFWFALGVDGLRLDAVPYLFEREGTNCENLPETHGFLKALRRHVDEKHPNRMLLAEANQWPEEAVTYFGNGDECHMAFHFPVMPRMFMAMHMEDRFPIVDILDQTPPIPDNCQWALFLRNHDELTLEMVTDEERDYMYRAYAHDRQARVNLGIRRRLAPLLGNNRRRIELMNGLLFSLPGTPVLYYGDEIGMGDNIYLGDRNGVRTPMQWSADRNAGFSRANPQRLYLPIIIDPEYHYEAINVEAQQNNPNSLLWWTKRLLAHRRAHPALGRGSIEFIHPENRKILAFLRHWGDEHLLVVANLSRFVQYVELDLTKYAGTVPVELFGVTPFPRIGTTPYILTMGPHSFYWFVLTPQAVETGLAPATGPRGEPSEIRIDGDWEMLFGQVGARQLEPALRQHLRRDGRHPKRTIRQARLAEAFRVRSGESAAFLAIVEADFSQGTPETIVVPIARASPEEAAAWAPGTEPPIIARLQGPRPGVLYEGLSAPGFWEGILDCVGCSRTLIGKAGGELVVWRSNLFDRLRGPCEEPLNPSRMELGQENYAIRFGNRLMLKVYRRIEDGLHPEVETGKFLVDAQSQACAAPLAAAVFYQRRRGDRRVLAVLHGYVPNEGDAWQYTLDVLSGFFEHVAALPPPALPAPPPLWRALQQPLAPPVEAAGELVHGYLEMAQLLGRRLRELHRALAQDVQGSEFATEPFSWQYQRAIYQSLRNTWFDVLYDLGRDAQVRPELRQKIAEVQQCQPRILHELRAVVDQRIRAPRMHCHGDCHLHEVLFTGKDFVFIDFEGRPAHSVGERWIKRSPMRDVVSMLRSFDYAAYAALFGLASGRGRATGLIRNEDRPALLPWATAWRCWAHDAFLRGYLDTTIGAPLLPADPGQRHILFRISLVEQILFEIAHDLEFRPDWLDISLTGLLEALQTNGQG